jgi:integrase
LKQEPNMGRPPSHRVTTPHPSPRFRDKIRLHQGIHGPADLNWSATFCIDGKWESRKPVSLRTSDFEEACEAARDKFTLKASGQPVVRSYAKPEPPKPAIANPFRLYAERAITELRQQADEADALVQGKGHGYRDRARRIERDLIPTWGDTDTTKLTEHALNDWIADRYRVNGGEKPARTTLGNLDWALRSVWLEAVADRIVERRMRPMINKSLGEDGEPRAMIDDNGVRAVAGVMTDTWITANGHDSDTKRMVRTYVAMIASTGIRPGLEAKRVRLGDVQFVQQVGRPVIIIRVLKNQGKHHAPRSVVVFEGNPAFPIRRLLTQHIAWRESQGADKTDYLFARPDGSFLRTREVLNSALSDAGALIDPMTGEKRVAYSFRHFFATLLIERGLSVPQVAAWLGTSSDMVEAHYNRFLTERDAYKVNGAVDEPDHYVDPDGTPWRWDAEIGEHGEWVPG